MSHECGQSGSRDSRESKKRFGLISGSFVWKRRGPSMSACLWFPPPSLSQTIISNMYAEQYRSIGLNQQASIRVVMRTRLMVIENVLRLSLAERPSIEWKKSRFKRIFERSKTLSSLCCSFCSNFFTFSTANKSKPVGKTSEKTSLVPFNKIDYLRNNKSYFSLSDIFSSSFSITNFNFSIVGCKIKYFLIQC